MGCGRYSASVSKFQIFCPQLNLQERLKVAEEQLVSRNEAESDLESLDDLKAELGRREKILRATEEERDTLMSELEELDQQNQEATQVCMTLVLYLFVYLYFSNLFRDIDIKCHFSISDCHFLTHFGLLKFFT